MKKNDPERAYQRTYDHLASSLLLDDPTSCQKPHCPPLLGCALGLWITDAVLLTLGRPWDLTHWFYLSCCGLLLLIPLFAIFLAGVCSKALFFLLGASLALSLSGAAVLGKTQVAEPLYNTSQQALVTVTKDASTSLYGQNAEVSLALDTGEVIKAQGRFPAQTETVRFGDEFRAIVTLSKPSGTSADFAWQSGCFLTAKIQSLTPSPETLSLRRAVLSLRNTVLDMLSAIPGDESALIEALACGYRKTLSEETYQDFKVCGLAHIIAVSGAHLSLVCAFVGCLLERLGTRKRLSIFLQLAFIVAYLMLAGMPISALRAAAMTTLSLCSFFAKRRPYALNALAFCIVTFIALDPFTAISVSFALSAGSTLGILLFSSLLTGWLRRYLPKMPRLFRDALALTFASNIITLPLSAAWFSQISLIAPIANGLTAPFFAPLCTLCLIGALFAFLIPGWAPVILSPLRLLARVFLALVGGIATIPYAAIPVTLGIGSGLVCALGLTGLLWHFWPQPPPKPLTSPKRRIPALALPAFCGALVILLALNLLKPSNPSCELRMLDVGQGDALLLRSQGASLLVDTGNQDSLLLQALARASVTHLDGILITHGDDDHMGSLDCLKNVISVDHVLVAQDALHCSCSNCKGLISEAQALVGADNLIGVSLGDSLQCGVFDLEVVWPKTFQDEGGNADSLCLLGHTDINTDGVSDHSFLLTGDAEYDQMNSLLDQGLVGDIDVYKVGHHGSKNALDEKSATGLNPELALISAGAHNRYGHPTQTTLDYLEAVEAHTFRTDLSGDVSCEFTLDGIEVSTQR